VITTMLRAHLDYVDGHTDAARDEVLAAFAAAPLAADVWDAFARFCAETDFDPATVVNVVRGDQLPTVLATLQGSEPAGVDRIVEVLWERNPNDPRLLAAATRFAPKLDTTRALEWSVRLRARGDHAFCPLVARAKDRSVDAIERLRAAILAYESFDDERARDAVEDAVTQLPDEQLAGVLNDMRSLAPRLSDSVVVAGASSAPRSLRLVTALWRGVARDEAYAVLVHGLTREDAAELDTETFAALLPGDVLEALADFAKERGDDEVATILWSVAAWSGE
jgi:hypothetical protein